MSSMPGPSLRFVHTSDWHLGHALHDHDRTDEHRAFLDWLLDLLEARRADALLVAGDVFDTAAPSAAAQALWYGFLARARTRLPRLETVVIGGNHDSPSRLEAPGPVLAALGVRVVGALPRGLAAGAAGRGSAGLDGAQLVVPLHRASGAVAARVAAVPFLRAADAGGLPAEEEGAEPTLVDGVRRVYASALDLAREARGKREALVAMGHGYFEGGRLSEGSERKVLGGNLNPLPADLFPGDVAYAALGHLHLAQAVAGRDPLRYSGSPIPLALDEDRYPHQVLVVDLDGPGLASVEPVRIPRSVDVLRLPADGPRPSAEVLRLVEALPAAPSRGAGEPDRRPYLELRITRAGRDPFFRQKADEALRGKDARLVRIDVSGDGPGPALADGPEESLADLSPEQVFRRLHVRERDGTEPSPALLAAFHLLLEAVPAEEGR